MNVELCHAFVPSWTHGGETAAGSGSPSRAVILNRGPSARTWTDLPPGPCANRASPSHKPTIDSVTTLGALSQSWIAAEASLPLGWRLTGLMQFGGEWVAFSEGPGEADHLEASGIYAYEALKRLSDRLRERRGPVSG